MAHQISLAIEQCTEGSAIIQLDHGGPLVRVEEVDDGNGQAHHEAEGPGDDDQPEAPAELEGELRTTDISNFCGGKFKIEQAGRFWHLHILNVDSELPVGEQPVVDGGGEEHGEAGEGHGVGAVAGYNHHEHVHDQPQDERGPQEDGGVVAGHPATRHLRITTAEFISMSFTMLIYGAFIYDIHRKGDRGYKRRQSKEGGYDII